jgi:hypothetical protein
LGQGKEGFGGKVRCAEEEVVVTVVGVVEVDFIHLDI